MKTRFFTRFRPAAAFLLICCLLSLPGIHAFEETPSIGFFGAARCFGGSCHLLNTGTQLILMDCGSFMDDEPTQKSNGFPFNPRSVDLVTLSHAHLDHCGRLPALFHHGFTGKVLCARPTAELTEIMLRVQQGIHAEHAGFPGYSDDDLKAAVASLTELDYQTIIPYLNTPGITFFPAEHILGSAMTLIEFDTQGHRKKLLFTGDFGNNTNGIMQPKSTLTETDYLVIESTYGGKIRENGSQELDAFYQMLAAAALDNGVVIIPSYVLARTQSVLAYIYKGIESGRIPAQLNVYVDSPTASRITRIYAKYPEHLLKPFQGTPLGTQSPFSFQSLFLLGSFREIQRPAVVICPSADASTGKVVTYLKRYISEPDTRICFVSSYHPEGSLSGIIRQKPDQIDIDGTRYPMRASVFEFGSFSAHGDQKQIMDWLKNFSFIRTVFIVHGDMADMQSLADRIKQTFHWNVIIPEPDKTYDLESGKSLALKHDPAPASK